jgi:hypothetical protein
MLRSPRQGTGLSTSSSLTLLSKKTHTNTNSNSNTTKHKNKLMATSATITPARRTTHTHTHQQGGNSNSNHNNKENVHLHSQSHSLADLSLSSIDMTTKSAVANPRDHDHGHGRHDDDDVSLPSTPPQSASGHRLSNPQSGVLSMTGQGQGQSQSQVNFQHECANANVNLTPQPNNNNRKMSSFSPIHTTTKKRMAHSTSPHKEDSAVSGGLPRPCSPTFRTSPRTRSTATSRSNGHGHGVVVSSPFSRIRKQLYVNGNAPFLSSSHSHNGHAATRKRLNMNLVKKLKVQWLPLLLGGIIVLLSLTPFVSFHALRMEEQHETSTNNVNDNANNVHRTPHAPLKAGMRGMTTMSSPQPHPLAVKEALVLEQRALTLDHGNDVKLSTETSNVHLPMTTPTSTLEKDVDAAPSLNHNVISRSGSGSDALLAQETSHQKKQRASQALDPFTVKKKQKVDSTMLNQDDVKAGINANAPILVAELDTSLPFLHILNTRFMQHQGNLTHLALARLELFKTFCLPTIAQQTIQLQADQQLRAAAAWSSSSSSPATPTSSTLYPFIWIIKTDPDLEESIRDDLVALLQPHPNFFLIGSNNNFAASYGTGIDPGSWRGGHAGQDALNATHVMYTPKKHRHMIVKAHMLRNDKMTIETRVDADDGLPLDYLEAVQRRAVKYLSTDPHQTYHSPETAPTFHEWIKELEHHDNNDNGVAVADDDDQVTTAARLEQIQLDHDSSHHYFSKAKWMFWCIPHSISWHPSILEDGFTIHNTSSLAHTQVAGRLLLDTNKGKKICMTPGLTVGMSVGTNDTSVPVESHYDLLHTFGRHDKSPKYNCALSKSARSCIDVLEHKRAVRSRTPTSAGLKGVGIALVKQDPLEIAQQWEYMDAVFGIPQSLATKTNFYLTQHLVAILEDNLAGQCTHGHSCKEKARLHLQHMIDAATSKNATHRDEVGHLLRHDSA